MKQFFEQYGGVALGILALLVLIAMITPVGNIIKTSLQGTVTKFSSSINGQMNTMAKSVENIQGSIISEAKVDSVILINGKRYRVIERYGTYAKVLALYNYTSVMYNNTSTTIQLPNGTYVQKYDGSNLDITLNNFYNTLPAEIQNAIAEQYIYQDFYTETSNKVSENSYFSDRIGDAIDGYVTKVTELEVGYRKVFAPSVEEIMNYIGQNLNTYEYRRKLFDGRNISEWGWLRSGSYDSPDLAYFMCNPDGKLHRWEVANANQVRPMFVIDLSMIDYEAVEE